MSMAVDQPVPPPWSLRFLQILRWVLILLGSRIAIAIFPSWVSPFIVLFAIVALGIAIRSTFFTPIDLPDQPPNTDTTVIVIFVHGTWARGTHWPNLEKALSTTLSGPLAFLYFTWSGKNSLADRHRESERLRAYLQQLKDAYPTAQLIVIAHSHGGNVALMAVSGTDLAPTTQVVLLSTPFVTMRHRPLAIRGRRLTALALALFIAVSSLSRVTVEGDVAALALVIFIAVFAGVFFGIDRFLKNHSRRLVTLARHGDLTGMRLLIIRSPSDEANLGLNLIQASAALATAVWSAVSFSNRSEAGKIAAAVAWTMGIVFFVAALLGVSGPMTAVTPDEVLMQYFAVPIVVLFYLSFLTLILLAFLAIPLAVAFGWHMLFMVFLIEIFADPVPAGTWTVHQLPPRLSGGGLRHSLSYSHPESLRVIAKWVAEQQV
jgi:hypothetical protein